MLVQIDTIICHCADPIAAADGTGSGVAQANHSEREIIRTEDATIRRADSICKERYHGDSNYDAARTQRSL